MPTVNKTVADTWSTRL